MKKLIYLIFLLPALSFAQSDAENQTAIDSLKINTPKKNNATFLWRLYTRLNQSKPNIADSTGLQPGMIMYWGTTAAPVGWLSCDGSAISRITYANLFAAIDSTFGAGDHSTTFNLPNGGGQFVAGYKSSDSDYNAINKTGGEKTHVLTTSEMPSHSHGVTDPGHTHLSVYNASGNVGNVGLSSSYPISGELQGAGSDDNYQLTGNTNTANVGKTSSSITGVMTNNAGSGSAHENRPPFVTLNMIIKY